MIFCNIEINKNKLEEFVRILLPEHYYILDKNSKEHIFINITEKNNIIEIETVLKKETENIENNEISMKKNGNIIKKINFQYEKIGYGYIDQKEVMAKTSLLKFFGKEKDYKWGTLIGVRPTKIVGRFLNMGLSYEKIKEILKNIYMVSDEKIDLLLNIAKRQAPYLDRETIGIYIGIAYCPTKCTYCSFPAYLLKISTIYIGGGTPSILLAKEIEKLLNTIKESYNLDNLKEFTFEAGRIDTLNRKKLEVIKNSGVNKISINPQSFNERTLKLVNRYHNKNQFDSVYNIAKELELEINMDLILGLPGETTEDILFSLEEIGKYNPENLTIHNLAIKNASELNKKNYRHEDNLDYEKIFEKINEVTEKKGLYPYYMYRQKNSFQWGENLGYSLGGSESVYNIEMIEENKIIIGIGAGAITKLIWKDSKKNRDNIKRLVNPKDPLVWINELDERLKNKKEEIRELYRKKDMEQGKSQ